MLNTRAGGVLMHITSLPSKYGIGVMGEETKRFVRRIKAYGVFILAGCCRFAYGFLRLTLCVSGGILRCHRF